MGMVNLRVKWNITNLKWEGGRYVMKRLYCRVSDDEYTDFKVAIAQRGLTVEAAIRKGLNILLFNPKTLENDHVRSSRSEEDQEAGQGN